jgi:hypothetical protein
MLRRSIVLRSSLAIALLCGVVLFAQKPLERPAENVNAQRNPNLAAAQKLCGQAFEEVTKAQKANKYDMKGHAQKAKQLLVQASQELAEADKIADSATPGSTSKNPASAVTSKLPH